MYTWDVKYFMYVMILNNCILDFKPGDNSSITDFSLYACYEDLF
jgi:hypothetical protein